MFALHNPARVAALFLAMALTGCVVADEQVTRGDPRHDRNVFVQSDLARDFRVASPSVVFFGVDTARLDAEARSRLRSQADWLRAHPEAEFTIFGYADMRKEADGGLSLAEARAAAVLKYLKSRGVSEERLVALKPKAKRSPGAADEARERFARRATTIIVGWTPKDPPHKTARVAPTPRTPKVERASVSSPPAEETPAPDPDPAPAPAPAPAPEPEDTKPLRPNNGKGNGTEGLELDPGKSGKTKAADND